MEPPALAKAATADKVAEPPRAPRALPATAVVFSEDVFADPADAAQAVVPAPAKRFPLGTLFFGAASLLVGMWATSAVYGLIERMFAVRPELGWLAAATAALAALALLGLIARELIGLARLSANAGLQTALQQAHDSNDAKLAHSATSDLVALASRLPATAAGRTAFSEMDRQFLSARDLVTLAEKDIVAPLDEAARRKVVEAARRVSVVTAVSPRAIIDIGYVLFENARLIRAIADIYGCRPGAIGFFRLARATLAHLAVTGVVAMGDSLVQQIVGHGVAARVSARLGEGVLNGVMTARIGFAAMDVTRPAPFIAVAKPKLGQIIATLSPLAADGTKP
jgi:putative membrane protein